MEVKFNRLNLQYKEIKKQLSISLEELFESSDFINGAKVKEFENSFAKYIGTNYAIGTSNGTDALMLGAKSLNISDSVVAFIPANTFISTILGIEEAIPNMKIELIDCDDFYLMDTDILEDRIRRVRKNYKNAIIVPVHLYGQTCNMKKIMILSKKYDCHVLEDASQAHGAISHLDFKAGSLGNISCFSLYPGKNLGAFGDAGIITTNLEAVASQIKQLRNLGSARKHFYEVRGFNRRLDTVQACVLIEKLKFLDKWNDRRIKIANKYISEIKNSQLIMPEKSEFCQKHVYHVFCVRTNEREELIRYLTNKKIEIGIHYPILPEETPIYKNLGFFSEKSRKFSKEIISLPIFPHMTNEEVEYVCDCCNSF